MRDCANCIRSKGATEWDNGCTSWDCDFIDRAEAIKVYKESQWIPLNHYEATTDFPYEMDGKWVLVTDGKNISVERIKKDAFDHFLPNGRWFEIDKAIAWKPLPEPMSELDKLEMYLKAVCYEYERIDREDARLPFDRHQIIAYKDGEKEWDAICQYGSYGYEEGLLEIYGSIVKSTDIDSVVGFLTADQVIERIKNKGE